MKAFKCDRCGELYEPYNMPEYNKVAKPNSVKLMCSQFALDELGITTKMYDLCPKCMSLLQDFLKRKGE